MNHHIIKMPDIGEGITEVEIAQWHVQPGDTVQEDDVVAEVMTDKASVEIPSSVAGTVVSLGGEVGDTVAVGAALLILDISSETAILSEAEAHTPAPATTRNMATEHGPVHKRVSASPSVRYRARQLGIELTELAPRDKGMRISHQDLDQYLIQHHTLATRESETVVKVVGLRRQMAQNMQRSTQRIPHFSYVEEVDVTELEALRAQLNARESEDDVHLTLLPFVVRALVRALAKHTEINAHYDEEAGLLRCYGTVHMGIATHTKSGLLVPVLRHAEEQDLWQCAHRLRALAQAARESRLSRDELRGSTITLSSLGALGGLAATPIINYPEVAIVGINRIVARPVVRDGAIMVRQTMNLSSSFDHRVIDGMHAALFIQTLRVFLETPALLFVD